MDELKARRGLYNGFGDALARGFEIAVTPFLVAALGFVIDRLTGLLPVFTIIFAVVGLVGVGIHTYFSYDAKMREEEAGAPWAGGRRG